ncbi:MAG: hypothetical protein ACKVT1_12055, partial [Dehalococcoidia bacterium]
MQIDTMTTDWTRKSAAATPITEGRSFCPPGESSGMERTRFFPRQLVTPDDLTQDQLYFRDKDLRHNRMLHGWGVVCGIRVMKHPTEKCKVVVESGYVLGPYGHEIVVDRYLEVDLCHEGPDGNAVGSCGGDPWCSDVRVSRPGGRPLYIAIRYEQCETRPVRAQGHGCGCGENECEYSRIRDSFVIKVLTDLPSTYSDPMPQPSILSAFRCEIENGKPKARACPPCPPEPWVILADVTLGDDGIIKDIDCFAHRRYVASFADFYLMCAPNKLQPGGSIAVLGEKAVLASGIRPAGVGEPAKMLIMATRPDGSAAYLPVRYTVVAGEKLSAFLAREGMREYIDPDTGEEVRLADVYAMAGANPERTLGSIVEANAVIEGVQLRVSDLTAVRSRLAPVIGEAGAARLAEAHAGAPAAVEALPAAAMPAVTAGSAIAPKLGARTLGEVARTEREAFVSSIVSGIPAAQLEAARQEAAAVWTSANEAIRLTQS